MVKNIVFIAVSYLLGSVPFGVILSKFKGVDPRKTGSGNIGATNVMRSAGKIYGVLTLLCDTLKGFVPVYLAKYMELPEIFVISAGLASFIGHVFPFVLKFKGGKGVATAFGVFLGLNFVATLLSLFIFIVIVGIWRYVSLGSIITSFSFPFILYLVGESNKTIVISTIIVALIILRHKNNLQRLIQGTEHRLQF
ncbi:MAG: glycerol-3-phosphate 1-O-acyltransferase PlsY [Deltaproteobacteria bacterium]|nr:glycerol-3-phosphate 1-O-acyltransferase PlsY [Deltaproteobacteria bacterium]